MAPSSESLGKLPKIKVDASKLSSDPSDLKLQEILDGKRCTPLTLREFENYLKHVEYSIENLQFHFWYKSYCQRFAQLPEHVRARCPPPPRPGTPAAAASSRATSWRDPSTTSHPASKATLIRDRLAANVKKTKGPTAEEPDSAATAVDPLGGFAADARRRASVPDTAIESSVLQRRRRSAINSPDIDDLGASPALSGFSEEDDRSSVYTIPVWAPENDPASPAFKNPFPSPGVQTASLNVPAIPVRASSYSSKMSAITKSGSRGDADGAMRVMYQDHYDKSDYPPRDASGLPLISDVSATHVPPPFAHEITLVLTTFFSSQSSRELNLDHRLRQSVLRAVHPRPSDLSLWGTTHPDVFREANDSVVRLMECSSLRGFLAWSTGNTNNPKRNFWFAIGAMDLAIGLLISLTLFAFAHSRGWRVLGLPFIAFGSMQVYSAYKNFCSVVHGRGARQLTPWELGEDSSGLASASASPMMRFTSTVSGTATERTIDSQGVSWSAELGGNNADAEGVGQASDSPILEGSPATTLREQCPFLFEDFQSAPPSPTMTRSSTSTRGARPAPSLIEGLRRRLTNESETSRWSRLKQRTSPRDRRRASIAEVKVPTFGPETAVEDPAVITLQAALIKKILVVGVLGVVVFGAVLLALPERG